MMIAAAPRPLIARTSLWLKAGQRSFTQSHARRTARASSSSGLLRHFVIRQRQPRSIWFRYGLIGATLLSAPGLVLLNVESQPADQTDKSSQQQEQEQHQVVQLPAEREQELENRQRSLLRRIWDVLDRNILEPLSTLRRFLFLTLLFLPVILTSPVLLRQTLPHRREPPSVRWWYALLVKQMERAGPTFIKLAQWAGSRRDLFPEMLCQMFGRLHSNGKPHSLHYTKKALERSFGVPFEDIFLEFNEEPLGIGAVAQVYKGTLKPGLVPRKYLDPKHDQDASAASKVARTIMPTPEDRAPQQVPTNALAIKILHPRVEKTITRDLKIMAIFASALNVLPGMRWISLPEEVDVFGSLMKSQLDLREEAHNLKRFEDNFRHRQTVSFPRPLTDYTSHNVLVEEFSDAVPLKYFLRSSAGPFDRIIANLGLDAFLNMLLIDNFVHSDLHPGNIMVKFFKPTTRGIIRSWWESLTDTSEPDPTAYMPQSGAESSQAIVSDLKSKGKDEEQFIATLRKLQEDGHQPELVFLDVGLVTELNDSNRKNFLDLFSAIAHFDGYKAGQLMVERCRSPDLVVDADTFALKMQKLVLEVKSQTFSLGKIRIADVLSDVLTNVRAHHVKMEADFVNTVLSVLLLEGIGRQLDPELDLFKSAIPILRRVGMQMNSSHLDRQTFGSMAKIYLWAEIRNLASLSIDELDRMMISGMLSPTM